jgi:hypothetical protein
MNAYKRSLCVRAGAPAIVLSLLATVACAQHVDIAVYQRDGQITLHNGSVPSQPETRVFRNDFDFWGAFNAYAGDDPGFQMSGSGAPSGYSGLPGNRQLRVDAVPVHVPGQAIGNLLFWDGVSTTPEFSVLPDGHDFYLEDAAMNERLFGGDLQRFEDLIGGVTDSGGGMHEHMTFAVENGGNAPLSGFYLMGWRLGMNGLDDSDLALVAITTPSISSTVKSELVDWLQTNLSTIRMVGDFDDNGLYEMADIDALVAEVASGSHSPEYDLTLDGLVDLADLDQWRAIAGSVLNSSGEPVLIADANLDGTVDGSDFLIWNNSKFVPSGAWSLGDFNADGVTDGADFLLWNNNKFQIADTRQNVPEAGLCWQLIVCFACFCWQRSRDESFSSPFFVE